MSKSDDTRQHIIKKAAPIFNKHGYQGTSMSQLTQAINMTKGAIYGNFKDKDELALAAFDYNMTRITKFVQKAVSPKLDACDKLIAFARMYLDNFDEIERQGGCPMLNTAVDSDHVHPELKKKVAHYLELWTDSITRILYKGIKNGQVSPAARPEQFASVYVSLIEGGIMMSKATGNTIHLSRNVDHIIYLINTQLRV